jgi:hypothetical protein
VEGEIDLRLRFRTRCENEDEGPSHRRTERDPGR